MELYLIQVAIINWRAEMNMPSPHKRPTDEDLMDLGYQIAIILEILSG